MSTEGVPVSAIGAATQAPSGAGPARTNNQAGGGGISAGQYQTISDSIGEALDPGGMRGLGLLVFMAVQIALKVETIELAKEYYKTNKRDYDFFREKHQPGMHQTASEAMSSVYNPSYLPDLYASAPAGLGTSKTIDRTWYEVRRRTGRYNVGTQHRMDYDFAVLRAAAIASGWNMGRRYEIAWADAHNERAYNRKMAAANMGVQAGNIVREGLATAVGKLESAYNGIGGAISSVGNGYYGKSGYMQGKQAVRGIIEENQNRVRYGEAT